MYFPVSQFLLESNLTLCGAVKIHFGSNLQDFSIYFTFLPGSPPSTHIPPPPRHSPTTLSGVTLPLFAPLIAPDCPSRSCIQIMALCPSHSDLFSFPPTDQSHCCLCILSSLFMKLSHLHTADCFSTFRFQFNCLLARGALTDHTQSHSNFSLFS